MFSFSPRRIGTRPTKSIDQKPEVIDFRGQLITVRRQAYKRSIGMTMHVSGRIRVSAPMGVPLARIEAFLNSQTEWIDNHLTKYKSLRDSYPRKRMIEGESFAFLGEELRLQFQSARTRRVRFLLAPGLLVCEIPENEWSTFVPSAEHPELVGSMIDFYMKCGRTVLQTRYKIVSETMDLYGACVSFRGQKTRWGSCSSRGRISLNWRLIFAPLEVIDYVIVHELSHLIHYNHSPEFWNLVSQHAPNYLRLRAWLKEHQYEADFLANRSELHV